MLNGTSMSTPCAAGVCALILQANRGLHPLELRSILQNTAEHFIPSVKGPFRTYANSNDPNYMDEGFDKMVMFAKDYRLNFPYLMDDSQDIARAYGAVCTPDPFLFFDGKLTFHGKINDALEPEARPTVQVMENNVRKLLKGERLEKDFDPSIGCSIKWKN